MKLIKYIHIFLINKVRLQSPKVLEERLLITGEYSLDGQKPDFQERAWILGI